MLTKNAIPTKIMYSFLINRAIRDDNDDPLFEVIQCKDIRTKKEADEIAKEIVKRYNSHEELVENLARLIDRIKENGWNEHIPSAYDRATELLQKVKDNT